jgi:hypothetical protein
MKSVWIVAAFVVTAVLGCSSSTSSTGSPGGAAGACLASSFSSGSAACDTCVENACVSEVNGLSTPCSGFISCACPGGTYSTTAASVPSCQSQLQTGSCSTAAKALTNCIASTVPGSCLNACVTPIDSGTGPSSDAALDH